LSDDVLSRVVRADVFFAAAGTDLVPPMRGVFFFFLAPLILAQTRPHDLERFLFVLLLAAPVLATNDPAGRNVENLHGGIGCVHPLAARAAGTADFDPQILGLQFEIDFFGFGKDSDSGSGSVNP